MTRALVVSLAPALLLASGVSMARASPPDAGAAADQAFMPGPGGGEPDAGSQRPPLESTGLEDTDLGCSCRAAGARAPGAWSFLVVALGAGAALGRRRSREHG